MSIEPCFGFSMDFPEAYLNQAEHLRWSFLQK